MHVAFLVLPLLATIVPAQELGSTSTSKVSRDFALQAQYDDARVSRPAERRAGDQVPLSVAPRYDRPRPSSPTAFFVTSNREGASQSRRRGRSCPIEPRVQGRSNATHARAYNSAGPSILGFENSSLLNSTSPSSVHLCWLLLFPHTTTLHLRSSRIMPFPSLSHLFLLGLAFISNISAQSDLDYNRRSHQTRRTCCVGSHAMVRWWLWIVGDDRMVERGEYHHHDR
jgi:hypothetical protein